MHESARIEHVGYSMQDSIRQRHSGGWMEGRTHQTADPAVYCVALDELDVLLPQPVLGGVVAGDASPGACPLLPPARANVSKSGKSAGDQKLPMA